MTHVLTRAWDSDAHPRAPGGSDAGGEFAPAGSSGVGKAAPPKAAAAKAKAKPKPKAMSRPGVLAYDPASGRGPGYGMKGGDPRVRKLQGALTRLGLTDPAGKKLVLDGKLGPRTTAAVKAAQKRLGLRPDGRVTPALLARLSSATSLPKRSVSPLDICLRSFDFETRSTGADGRTLEGYAAVFDSPARIADLQGDFDEVIRPGAFTRSLAARTPVLQFEHGRDPRVGAVPIGAIQELREDGQGLYVRARLFDNPVVDPVRQAIAERAITGMSFRFGVPDKGDTWTRRAGEPDRREIRDADIHELGPVVFPAYDATTVGVRSLLAQLDPTEHRALIRELAAELRLAVDLEDLTGRSDAWSADGGDLDAEPGNGDVSASLEHRFAGDGDSLKLRGIT